jgi:serine O-acetyltransferase
MYLRESLENILDKDPAARSRLEVILCYPGFHALIFHKFAHRLWLSGVRTPARFISHLGRVFTGIEIHPGATIGRRVFIDHGMGVVIGETAVVGDDCVIYQGVTLGAGAAARQGALSRDTKRHPTLGNSVIVGSGAEIQGAIVLGDNVRVASRSMVLKDVPANSVVVGVPGRITYRDGLKVEAEKTEKPQEDVPDIEAEAIKSLNGKLSELELLVRTLQSKIKQQNKELVRLTERVCPELPPMDKTDSQTNNSNSSVDLQAVKKQGDDPVDVFLQGAGI